MTNGKYRENEQQIEIDITITDYFSGKVKNSHLYCLRGQCTHTSHTLPPINSTRTDKAYRIHWPNVLLDRQDGNTVEHIDTTHRNISIVQNGYSSQHPK